MSLQEGLLLGTVVLAALVTLSTLKWVRAKGLSTKSFTIPNQYTMLVTMASISSLIQAVTCFVNVMIAPNHVFGFSLFIVLNWVVMTHSSVMVVSRKLSLTYRRSSQAWRRLLLLNAIMLPLSIFICGSWTMAHNSDSETLHEINRLVEPIQIALWGLLEFCLSGMFIVKMWHIHWTAVERRAIAVLVLVAACDCASVLINVLIGDLESTCVKGFVYALRIRLEVSVLCSLVNFCNAKRAGLKLFESASGDESADHPSWFALRPPVPPRPSAFTTPCYSCIHLTTPVSATGNCTTSLHKDDHTLGTQEIPSMDKMESQDDHSSSSSSSSSSDVASSPEAYQADAGSPSSP